MPNRHYSDTALTEELVFNVTTYEKTVLAHDFDGTTHAWSTSTNPAPGPTAASVDGRLQVASTKANNAVFFNYDTKVGEKYKFYVLVDEGDCDSLLIRVQEIPVSLKEERYIGTGLHEFEFTASTSQTRLRLHRKDANKQGTMHFYLEHVALKQVRDTLYQDTVIVATSNGYRYGFNGMERDDEINGVGNSYTTHFRQYDSRLGKWLSLDPLMVEFPWQSPYAAMDNNPISLNDPLGLSAGDPDKENEVVQSSYIQSDEDWEKLNLKNVIISLREVVIVADKPTEDQGAYLENGERDMSNIRNYGTVETSYYEDVATTWNPNDWNYNYDYSGAQEEFDLYYEESGLADLDRLEKGQTMMYWGHCMAYCWGPAYASRVDAVRVANRYNYKPRYNSNNKVTTSKEIQNAKTKPDKLSHKTWNHWGNKNLPKLDNKGVVHGPLPYRNQWTKHSRSDLSDFLDNLEASIAQRKAMNELHGLDYGHSIRIHYEQTLYRDISTYLYGK